MFSAITIINLTAKMESENGGYAYEKDYVLVFDTDYAFCFDGV